MTRTDSLIDFWNACDCYYEWHPVASTGWYGVRWTGSVRIDVAGNYAFGTMSDDGSQVWLDGNLIVDNAEEQWWDWEDSLTEGSYTGLYPEGNGRPDSLPGPLYLTTGYHAIEVRFYEARSFDGIELWWLKPGSGPSDIPYYGVSCYSGGVSANAATNWEIVPWDVLSDWPVSVREESQSDFPTAHAAVPNPFSRQTVIRYELPQASHVELRIYDVTGRRVKDLVDGPLEAGRQAGIWDGRDNAGAPVPAGVYFYRLETHEVATAGKLVKAE
jgi:hypothetical protein